jgi:DNA-directed RNA polymerase alpha subunit
MMALKFVSNSPSIPVGYVPAEKNRPEEAPIGMIPVDSLYSPVRRVSYNVENTREGQVWITTS